MVVQKYYDKKKSENDPLKIRAVMLALDEYLRIFILPQIPAGFKDFREDMRNSMNEAWRAMYAALSTSGRKRQHHLLELKVELAMIETYLQEIRDVCYRGKEKRKLDKNSARRFEICGNKQKEVMRIVWKWAKNENAKLDSTKSQQTVGLIEKEEISGTSKN